MLWLFGTILLLPQAMVAQQLPGSVDPGRFGQRVQEAPSSRIQKEYAPSVQDGNLIAPPEPADGFVLQSIEITGATAFPLPELEALYQPLIGKKANLATLEYAARLITLHYHKHGYILSQALLPAQDVKEGRVRIAVAEGYVSDVRIENAERYKDNLGILDDARETILAMRPLHGPTLEGILLSLNASGGIQSKALMEPLPPGKAKPGAVGLVITLTDAPGQHRAMFDNYGSRFGGPWQMSGYSQFFPELIGFDTLNLAALTSIPPGEAEYVSADYTVPILADGTTAGLSASYSVSAPGYTLEASDIDSVSTIFSARVSHPFIRTRATSWDITPSFEIRNIGTDLLKTEFYTDHIRALRLSSDFSHADAWDGTSYANLRLSRGLDILNASQNGSLNLSRAEGHSDFTKGEASLSRLQQIGRSWQAYLSASGQYASDPLLSSEEFGFGGQSFGRAYDPSELTGDHGISAAIELRYNGIAPIEERLSLQPFVFYDVGKVWNLDTGGDQLSGASAGVGLRVQHVEGPFATLTAAYPLTRSVQSPISGNGKSPRLLFQTGVTF